MGSAGYYVVLDPSWVGCAEDRGIVRRQDRGRVGYKVLGLEEEVRGTSFFLDILGGFGGVSGASLIQGWALSLE